MESSQGVSEGVLAVACLGIVSSQAVLCLCCCWTRKVPRLLSDNWSLLIYNVKLNVSLSPASTVTLQADSGVMQAATLSLTGSKRCQKGCRMLHPHDLKYKSISARLPVSYVCTVLHAHPHTHTFCPCIFIYPCSQLQVHCDHRASN